MESEQTSDSRRKFLIKTGKVGLSSALLATFPNRSVLAQQQKEWSPSAAASMNPSVVLVTNLLAQGFTPGQLKNKTSEWPGSVNHGVPASMLNRRGNVNGQGRVAFQAGDFSAISLDALTPGEIHSPDGIYPFADCSMANKCIIEALWTPNQSGTDINRIKIGIATIFNAMNLPIYPVDPNFACQMVWDMLHGNRPSNNAYQMPELVGGSVGNGRLTQLLSYFYKGTA